MMLPSSLLISLLALTSTTLADDGQWRPEAYGGATTTALATATATAAAQTHGTATATTVTGTAVAVTLATDEASGDAVSQVTATQIDATATGGWESQVTWPAGCEEWANPCPPGAHISGGGVAGYTNGFTSFLTETDSNGVITGMPTKATVAAGLETDSASAVPTTLSTATSSGNRTASISDSSSTTQRGFSTGTSSPIESNGAGRNIVAGGSMLLFGAATMVFFC